VTKKLRDGSQVCAGGYLQSCKGVAESVDGCIFESGVCQEFFVPFCDGLIVDGGSHPIECIDDLCSAIDRRFGSFLHFASFGIFLIVRLDREQWAIALFPLLVLVVPVTIPILRIYWELR